MEWNKQTVKYLLLVVCGGAAFFVALQNLGVVAHALGWLVGILAPFLLGAAIAFVLNVPMRAIERHLFPNAKRGGGVRRPLALVLTLVAVIGVLVLASCVIGPGIRDAVKSIASQAPAAFDRLYNWLLGREQYLPQIEAWVQDLSIDWKSLSQKAIQLAQSWGGSLLSTGGGLIGGVVSGVSTFVIGMTLSL